MQVIYARAYECLVVVLATIDAYVLELVANPNNVHRKIVLDALTAKILPPGHEF